MHPISFAVQSAPRRQGWDAFARDVEQGGFEALCVADHPGLTLSPYVTLAAVAPATSSLALGVAVGNAGVRHPFDIASDLASLDVLSDGRAYFGIGAGHTPAEWAAFGLPYPTPAGRVERLEAVVRVVSELLAGETVDLDGPGFALTNARLEISPPRRIPLLLGGNNRALIRMGAQRADVVELSGLGRTLEDGHHHEVRWRPDQIDDVVAVFHDARGDRDVRLGALAQAVVVTDDAGAVAAEFLESAGEGAPDGTLPTVDELLAAPFVLIGTTSEIAQKLLDARARWGFSRYTVREPAIDAITEVMRILDDGQAGTNLAR